MISSRNSTFKIFSFESSSIFLFGKRLMDFGYEIYYNYKKDGKIEKGGRISMNKISCLIAVLLLLVETIIGGCTTVSTTTTILTKTNLPILEGRWEGSAVFGGSIHTTLTLDIYNNSLPLKGKVSIQNIPREAANIFPGGFEGSGWESYFDTGTITDNGSLVIKGRGGNFGEFSLIESESKRSLLEGESKLDGWFYLWGAKGAATLHKGRR
jgi:hypothetical protein